MLERIPGQYSIVKMIMKTEQENTTGFKKRFRNNNKAKEVLTFDDEEEEEKKGLAKAEVKHADPKEKLKNIIEEKKISIYAEFLGDEMV